MADETKVDEAYKLNFNLGYFMAQSPETNELLKRLMKVESPEARKVMEDGKRQFQMDAVRDNRAATMPQVDMEEAWYETLDRDVRKQEREEKALFAAYDSMIPGDANDEQIVRYTDRGSIKKQSYSDRLAQQRSSETERPGGNIDKQREAVERMNKRREEQQRDREKGRGGR
ncbi:hypothetical protein K3G63_04565 [Hymenobacter sp. HSC-4F20]|uniref:hypothetical protein n=1 Tax=Hymenobacter sp. HSC-4F20 TaxID=2864135 RepID=UPI001C72CFD3|nr:hypothetical protein [Hymenobacter sp. HSC-4F20]MBX0289696.1 hypothetical protein [Hymenobacter sp. HSC-4F20]